ncbi:MAG: efflux RND transporter permease subunit [Desulfosoma sp.]|uniref:efflux RND transporter permease subunit n=1 Tax=Desulfosoma sp. TaxID=2603217 RepID=UPI00404B3FD9
MDYLRLEGHPDTVFYDYFQTIFEKDEFFVIAIESDNFFTKEGLLWLRTLTFELEKIPEIRRVLSLSNAVDITAQGDTVLVGPILEEIPETTPEIQKLKARVIAHPVYGRQLISSTGQVASIIVFPSIPDHKKFDRKALLQRVDSVIKRAHIAAHQYHLAGWTVVNLALSQYMNEDLLRFIPLTYFCVAVILFFVLRSLRLTLVGMAHILLCTTSTMGFFAVAKISLNNVTCIVPPLITALSLSDSVHILSYVQLAHHDSVHDIEQKTFEALKELFSPCFLTSLTTLAGFLSLATSHMPPIRHFAYTASAGIIFEFFYFLFLVPPLLIMIKPRSNAGAQHSPRRLFAQGSPSFFLHLTRHPRLTAAVFAGATVLFLAFIPFLSVNTNILDNFRSSDAIRRSVEYVERHLCGTNTIDIAVMADPTDALLDARHLASMDRFAQEARHLDSIDHVSSLADIVKHTHQVMNGGDPEFFRVPDTTQSIAQYLLLYDPEDIDDYINDKRNISRIIVFTHEHNSKDQERLLETLRSLADKYFQPPLRYRITGRVVEQVNNIDEIVQSQLKSLALASFLIWMTIFIYYRSWTVFWISIPPNIFPIALNFALMALFGIPLNTATALIAAVGIGIAVDGTLHILSSYIKALKSGMQPVEACVHTLHKKWGALSTTSAILTVAFAVLLASRFVPTNQFGVLSSIIMLSALAADLIFLPSLLLGFLQGQGPRGRKGAYFVSNALNPAGDVHEPGSHSGI